MVKLKEPKKGVKVWDAWYGISFSVTGEINTSIRNNRFKIHKRPKSLSYFLMKIREIYIFLLKNFVYF